MSEKHKNLPLSGTELGRGSQGGRVTELGDKKKNLNKLNQQKVG